MAAEDRRQWSTRCSLLYPGWLCWTLMNQFLQCAAPKVDQVPTHLGVTVAMLLPKFSKRAPTHVLNSISSLQHIAAEILALHELGVNCVELETQFRSLKCIQLEHLTLRNVFAQAVRSATNRIFMYTNSDIVYFPGLGRTLEYVSSEHECYLVIAVSYTHLTLPTKA